MEVLITIVFKIVLVFHLIHKVADVPVLQDIQELKLANGVLMETAELFVIKMYLVQPELLVELIYTV